MSFHFNPFGQVSVFNFAYILLLYLVLLEAALLSLCFGCIKGLRLAGKFTLARGLLLATVLAWTAYFIVLGASWISFSYTAVFIDTQALAAVPVFFDPTSILRLITARELTQLALLFAAIAVILIASFYASRIVRNPQQLRLRAKDCFILLGFVLALGALLRFRYADPSGINHALVKHYVSPRLTLFAADLIFPSDNQSYETVELEANPAYTAKQYAERVSSLPKKNVVVIMIEALRADLVELEVEGKAVMPHTRALARDGILVERAYAASNETAYSQLAVNLGQYPLRFPLRDSYQDTAYGFTRSYDLFHALGYRTLHLTFEWQTTRRISSSSALDIYIDADTNLAMPQTLRDALVAPYNSASTLLGVPATAVDPAYLRIVRDAILSDSSDSPVFALMYLYSTHFPYRGGSNVRTQLLEVDALTEVPSFFGYPPALAENLWKRYLNMAHYVDSLIGDFVASLAEAGALENTILVITGDHGELFHDPRGVTHGRELHENSVRVPLVLFGIDSSGKVERITQPVSHVDILPTLLDALELPPFAGFQGNSFIAPASLHENAAHPPVFISTQGQFYQDAVIRGQWKLIRDSRKKDVQLFDLESDPQELSNLATKQKSVASELEGILDEFRNRQLSFYGQPRELRAEQFPPRHWPQAPQLPSAGAVKTLE